MLCTLLACVYQWLNLCFVMARPVFCNGLTCVFQWLDRCFVMAWTTRDVPTQIIIYFTQHLPPLCVFCSLAHARHINLAYTRVMAGNYSLGPLVGMELRNKNVGIIGTGAIGAEAARMFKGLGMDVMAYDIKPNPAVEALGIPYMSIEEMLPQCDVVSLHVPMLPSTYKIINKERINMSKKGCILLNVSRGGLIDSDEVMNGLESQQIGALGLDVWENEADLFFTDWTDLDITTRMTNWDRKFKVLTSYPNVIVTPHSAFLTNEALENIANTTIQNIEEFLLGKPLTNELKAK
eukprot:GHUV01018835.1.p1 GENE.GHUV01018835.1~~GHUV01018835.1.p1  ORF type:complete len:293 (+),score=47.53 GHUV01018835.1:318-1196(+)